MDYFSFANISVGINTSNKGSKINKKSASFNTICVSQFLSIVICIFFFKNMESFVWTETDSENDFKIIFGYKSRDDEDIMGFTYNDVAVIEKAYGEIKGGSSNGNRSQ